MIIIKTIIVISAIITLVREVGKYVSLTHFWDADRPIEAECLITGNSFKASGAGSGPCHYSTSAPALGGLCWPSDQECGGT